MNIVSVVLKWLAVVVRNFLNGYIDPGWEVKQEQLQTDAAAFQRQHAETEKANAEIDKRVEARDAAIEVRDKEVDLSQSEITEHQRKRAERANEKPGSVAEILGFTDKP